jgi:cation transport ATPase
MKTKKVLIILGIVSLVIAITLISLRAYYVLIAILAGGIILTHRELWSLARTKRLPPMDERVKENTSRAMRNGFFFLAAVLIFLMLFFSINSTAQPLLLHIISGLFISTGIVYMCSYIFYDRAQPGLSQRKSTILRTLLMVTGISVAVFIVGAFLHNILSGLFNTEEPVFFIVAVIIAPLGFAVGLLGCLVIFILGIASPKL